MYIHRTLEGERARRKKALLRKDVVKKPITHSWSSRFACLVRRLANQECERGNNKKGNNKNRASKIRSKEFSKKDSRMQLTHTLSLSFSLSHRHS